MKVKSKNKTRLSLFLNKLLKIINYMFQMKYTEFKQKVLYKRCQYLHTGMN